MVMTMEYKSWVNKPVIIRKTDGFVKYGIVLSVHAEYLLLNFFDGRSNVIFFEDIVSIEPYKKGEGGYER